MIVLVCGGRKYADKEYLKTMLDAVHEQRAITLLIQGGATGADTLAAEWALKNEINYRTYPAKWKRIGDKSAGMKRNKEMLDDNPNIDLLVAFDGGVGTAGMVKLAKERDIAVLEAFT